MTRRFDLDFIDAMMQHGIKLSQPFNEKPDINRAIDTEKSQRNDDAWYCYTEFSNIAFGTFGSWAGGGKKTMRWCSKDETILSEKERADYQDFQLRAREKRAAIQHDATMRARQYIPALNGAQSNHPYLQRKKISGLGIKQDGQTLIVPAYGHDGQIQTYQIISAVGKKMFAPDRSAKDIYFVFEGRGNAILMCEGYATGHTLHDATDLTVYCALTTHNFVSAAKMIRSRHKERIIICADHDQWVFKDKMRPDGINPKEIAGDDSRWEQWRAEGRLTQPGMEAAKAAMETVADAVIAHPVFTRIQDKPTDFNDLFCQTGDLASVKDALSEHMPLLPAQLPVMASLVTDFDFQAIPKREWLYGNHLIRRFCSATISPGGVGKTQLVMTDAVALATGRALLRDMPQAQVKAWHYNLEDPLDELQRRLAAICIHFNVKTDELRGNLFLNSGRERRLIVLEKSKDGQYARPDADGLYKAIRDNGISYLSIDPFVRVHHAGENENKDIDEVLNIFSQIANDTNCAIDLVHHTKKMGKESGAGNLEMARGASAMAGAVRSARTLTVMSEKEAELFHVEPKRRQWYVRVDSAKSNMAAPSEETNWFQRHSVTLPNGMHGEEGDSIGVIEAWQPPQVGGDVDPVKVSKLFDAIDQAFQEGEAFGTRHNSSRYIVPVMQEILGEYAQVCRSLLKKWLHNENIVEENIPDKQRRKFYIGLSVNSKP